MFWNIRTERRNTSCFIYADKTSGLMGAHMHTAACIPSGLCVTWGHRAGTTAYRYCKKD